VTVSGIPKGYPLRDRQISMTFTPVKRRKKSTMKAMLGCTFNKVCNDIPGACIVLQMILVVALSGVLGYLFVTQELLK